MIKKLTRTGNSVALVLDKQLLEAAHLDPEKPVELPITDTLDLHPFRPNEIRDVVNEYLQAARDKGFRQLRLIHGKGERWVMALGQAATLAGLLLMPWVVETRGRALPD